MKWEEVAQPSSMQFFHHRGEEGACHSGVVESMMGDGEAKLKETLQQQRKLEKDLSNPNCTRAS